MKIEWKKQDKKLYLPKDKPEVVVVPSMKFFMLDGKGNPNCEEFSRAVGLLYGLSYAIKMLPKKGAAPQDYYEYTVFPLEGVWDLDDKTKDFDSLDKDNLAYTIMIRQPDFVTEEIAHGALESVRKKNSDVLLEKVRFGSLEDGMCVQMLHMGPYDSEPASFERMEDFCKVNGLRRAFKTHREIYISDPRKTSPDKLRTVLRIKVESL